MNNSTSPKILNGKWDLYYHLPSNSNWDLSSYKTIMKDISTVEEVISLNEKIDERRRYRLEQAKGERIFSTKKPNKNVYRENVSVQKKFIKKQKYFAMAYKILEGFHLTKIQMN